MMVKYYVCMHHVSVTVKLIYLAALKHSCRINSNRWVNIVHYMLEWQHFSLGYHGNILKKPLHHNIWHKTVCIMLNNNHKATTTSYPAFYQETTEEWFVMELSYLSGSLVLRVSPTLNSPHFPRVKEQIKESEMLYVTPDSNNVKHLFKL